MSSQYYLNIRTLCLPAKQRLLPDTHQPIGHYDAHTTTGTNFINICKKIVLLVSEEAEQVFIKVLLYSPVSIIPSNNIINFNQIIIRVKNTALWSLNFLVRKQLRSRSDWSKLKKKSSRDPHEVPYSVRITRNKHCAGTFCARQNVNFSGLRRKYKQGYNVAWNVRWGRGQHKWELHNLTVAERIASWLLASRNLYHRGLHLSSLDEDRHRGDSRIQIPINVGSEVGMLHWRALSNSVTARHTSSGEGIQDTKLVNFFLG